MTTRRTGFTLIELLVVIVIIAVIAAILFPVFARVRERGRQTTCASNLRQIGMAAMQYAGDSDGLLFNTLSHADDFGRTTHWSFCSEQTQGTPDVRIDASCGPLAPFIKSEGVWRCPSASGLKTVDHYSAIPPAYGLNIAFTRSEISQGRPVAVTQVASPSETILAADSAFASSGSLSWTRYIQLPSDHEASVHGRHSGRGNVLWLDGHVNAQKPVPPDAQSQALDVGDILRGPYTGDAKTDDYYYELVKPAGG